MGRVAQLNRPWALVTSLSALALCASRLTATLGYEHAFLSGLLISVSAGHIGIISWREASATASAQGREAQLMSAWREAGLHSSLLALIPLCVGALNGLRVGSCDALEGLGYYLILPMCTAWVASAWGVVAAALGRGLGAYLLAYLVSLIYVAAQVWWTPIIDPFHPLFAYYPGAIYDELLSIDERLLWSRLEDVLWAVAALSALRWRRSAEARGPALVTIGALMCAWFYGGSLDLRRTAGSVQERLGGRLESEHFVLYHPAAWEERRVQGLATELEFLYQELSQFFGRGSSRKISAYLYRDAQQKKRLMGAARTRVAKPWQYGIHVHSPLIGQSVLKHELAHVFSAEIAPAPHHLSLHRGLIPHMPLIEGLAEAATWREGPLTPHQLSAALRQEGLAPPIERLLSPQGFYLSSSSVAYTLCGSLMRFYREEAGQEALAALYASGGALEPSALKALTQRWEAQLDRVELNPQERRVIAQRLNRPSIFYKVCPHEVAEVRGRASRAAWAARWGEALEGWRELRAFSRGDRGAIRGELIALYELGRWEELAGHIERELATDDSPLWLYLEEWRIDLMWAIGPSAGSRATLREAIESYRALLERLPDRGPRRQVSVKLACAERQLATPSAGAQLGLELVKLLISPSAQERPYHEELERLASETAPWPILTYLRARAALNQDELERALELLAEALQGLSQPDLTFESERLIARLNFRLGETDKAHYLRAAERYLSLAARRELRLTEGERDELEEWGRRAQWFADHATRP